MQNSPSNWLIASGKAPNGISPLGAVVAEVLKATWGGIHHVPFTKSGVAWDDPHAISITLSWQTISTVDDSNLTALVVFSHDNALRMEIKAKSMNHLELIFHQRQREGSIWDRCPTIENHIAALRLRTSIQKGDA